MTRWIRSVLALPRKGLGEMVKRPRMSTLVLLGLIFAIFAWRADNYSLNKAVELATTAQAGSTTVGLSDDERWPMSPGCGCFDPSSGKLDWFGMNLPSDRFDLDLSTDPAGEPGTEPWSLTALSPTLESLDWYIARGHSIFMTVIDSDSHRGRVVFAGRTNDLTLLTEGEVQVRYGRRYPYAALLPAAGGAVSLNSEPPVRTGFGTRMNVAAESPPRDSVEELVRKQSEPSYREHTDLTMRGPMVDVLGPGVSLFVPKIGSDSAVYAGLLPIDGLRAGDSLTIEIRTPFALRLIPHPVTGEWRQRLPDEWQRRRQAADERFFERENRIGLGAALQDRFADTDQLPAFSVRLRHVQVPTPEAWRRFARKSTEAGTVVSGLDSLDSDAGNSNSVFQLPPVAETLEVGIFGPLAKLESSSLEGQIFTDGKAVSFGRGQNVDLDSDDGLITGRYQMTPLVSAGLPTARANVAGHAKVSIDGEPVNKVPILSYLAGALALALLGLGLERVLRWGLSDTKKD